MPKGSTSRVVLIVDDEPEFLGWVAEFLGSLDLKVDFATNVTTAINQLQKQDYRIVLLDMNIPTGGASEDVMSRGGALSRRYPGLAVAFYCRNHGYGAHQVIAYTVHDDDAADAELGKLSCRYVLKSRPHVLKRVVRTSLPTRGKTGAGRTATVKGSKRRSKRG